MNPLNIGENLLRLRHEKKLTQEQVADFIGVTKASVSKWETCQSMPDIMLLPQLAAFFDVSVDELLGYEPQLSREQIGKLYRNLAQGFATEPFEDMMAKTRKLVKQYYSCYPFLFQICVLWLNHCSLVKEPRQQTEILQEMVRLCDRITENCTDFSQCGEAVVLRAQVNLILGRGQEAVEELEEYLKTRQMTGRSEILLIQGYQQTEEAGQAAGYAQLSMYSHLMSLLGVAGKYLAIDEGGISRAEETIRRIEAVTEAYHLVELQPNGVLQFYYEAARLYCRNQQKQKAIIYVGKCVDCMVCLLKEKELMLHGDAYFNRLLEQFERIGASETAPRERELVVRDIRNFCEDPSFEILREEPEFILLKKRLQEVR